MEKRDYVNLQEIEKQAKSPDYKGTISVNAISEQEIVKPYLERLMIEVGNLEINKPMMSGYGFKQKSPQEIKDEVMKLIDNLLTEGEEDGETCIYNDRRCL